jgi:hypothetical protein
VLAFAGFLLVVSSGAIFYLRVRLGLYSRYPYEQFVLVGAAVVVGLVAALTNPGVLTLLLLGLEIAALALVVRYLFIGERFPEAESTLKTGEPFPDFRLPDSEGRPFESRLQQRGTSALYVFYRGHF